MPKRKVIEDSDDEDNVETTPRRHRAIALSETNADTAIDLLDSPGGNDVHQSADPSTGSTELLNREIRAAHKSLIDPTPDGSLPSTRNGFSSQGKSQPSPTISRTKIQRAKTSVEKPRVKKPLKKYGTESNRATFDFHEGSDEEFEGSPENNMGPRNVASSWGLSTGKTLALEGTDPFRVVSRARSMSGTSCMPPPASRSTSQMQATETSTVATTTDEIHAKSTPAEPKATENTESVEPTSSESRMPDPTMSSRGRGDVERRPDIDGMEELDDSLGLDRDANTLEPVERSSSASVLSPSKTITVVKRDLAAQPLVQDGGIYDNEPMAVIPVNHASETIEPVVLLPEPSHGPEGMDELSLPSHGPETWSINQTTVSKARKRKNENVQADAPGSDDAAIGLPKDQYQPRPSKSRSGRGTEEVVVPADFSKKPEAVVKKKSRAKRSKTTAFHELRAKEEDEEEEDPITYKPAMEAIENIPTKKFEKRKEPGVTEQTAASDLDEKPQPGSKPVAKEVEGKKLRGRPKKGVTEAPESKALEILDTDALQVEFGLEKVQVPAPAKKAKRGAKAKQAPLAISEELVHDSDDELGNVDEIVRDSSNIPSGIQGNGTSPKSAQKAATLPSPIKVTASSPARAIETPPETPRKTGTPAQKGPDKHSPISSGKVAYRVGLSKRARIAPLLRIVRKA